MAEPKGRIQFGEDNIEHQKTVDSNHSAYKRKLSVHETDAESTVSATGNGVRESDFKKKQVFKGWTLLWLAYQSTGVIYGDIGTSPLYTYSSTFTSEPERADLLGALSLIIWTLTIMVTLKYVCIVLLADDEGEGGTFALYTLLSRYSNIMRRDPRVNQLIKIQRYSTNDLNGSNRGVRNWLEKSRIAHAFLRILAVLGVSLIIADGLLTPAQSVLGAIQGLTVINPNISTGTVVGVTCAIIIVVYAVQPFGLTKVSSAFAPIVIIWLLGNGIFGIYNLAYFDHTVLKAFSPYYAGQWFVRNGTNGWINLGGILLVFTGVEALFADLGAFSRSAIQLSWLCLAYPCLLLAYIGQAAYISVTPSAYANPFFESVPPGMYWPSLVMAILATIVASQAIITGTFQLLSQVIAASYFPRIKMVYKSQRFHGQVYIPIANWLMMIGTVIVTAVYNNTTSLGQAYGACVILVTFITTNMVALVAIVVWRVHPALVFLVWLPFVTFDGLYLTAALTKVPNGAWFTLLLAVLMASFLSLWRWGKETQWTCEAKNQHAMSDVLVKTTHGSNGAQIMSEQYGGGELTEMDGMGIFFDKSGDYVPTVYIQWLLKFRAQMDVVVLMHLRTLSIPHVSDEDKFAVSRTSAKNVYRLIVRSGYSDRVITPDLAHLVYNQIRAAIVRSATQASPSAKSPAKAELTQTHLDGDEIEKIDDAALAARLKHLDEAYETQTLFLVGKQQMRVSKSYNFVKRNLLAAFLFVREITRNKIENLSLPVEKLVEVGYVGEI